MKHVLLTGAGGGIGAAAALRLADSAEAFTVHAGVRGPAPALEEHERIRLLRFDVTDPAQVAEAVRELTQRTGGELHAVVNNAGVIVQGPLELVPPTELHRQFAVNVYGPAAVTAAVLPLLRNGGGRVVNVSAPTARIAVPFAGPIGASKAALESLSEAWRGELAQWRIPVSLVVPGAVETQIFAKAAAASEKAMAQVPGDLISLYEPALAAVGEALGKVKPAAVDGVVKAIVAAVTARSPKRRYVAGRDARMFAALSHLPEKTRGRMVMSTLGLRSLKV